MKAKKSKKAKKSTLDVRAGPSTDKPADVWFDGVDKKLIANNEKRIVATEVEKNRQICSKGSLFTKTPLQPLSAFTEEFSTKSKKKEISEQQEINSPPNGTTCKTSTPKNMIKPHKGLTDELAIDCEMVGSHNKSILARVSIVNLFGHLILDSYVAPTSKVTDYRTRWSGIRPEDIDHAPDFKSIQREVAKIIDGRIVVGHAVHNDFAVLKISHPPELIRDTCHYYKNRFQGTNPSLKKLSESYLGITIQNGEHDSVQDAQATMRLYVMERDNWIEKFLTEGQHPSLIKELKSNNVYRRTEKQEKKKKKKVKTKPKSKKIKTIYVMTT